MPQTRNNQTKPFPHTPLLKHRRTLLPRIKRSKLDKTTNAENLQSMSDTPVKKTLVMSNVK